MNGTNFNGMIKLTPLKWKTRWLGNNGSIITCSTNGKGGVRGWADIHSLKPLVTLEPITKPITKVK